jgi:hypothetical protein
MNTWLELLQLISYVIIAGAGLYFIIKDRIAPYITVIHSKRIEGFLEVTEILATIYNSLKLNFYPQQNFEERPFLNDEIKYQKREKLKSLSKKWEVVLPEKLNNNIKNFLQKYTVLVKKVKSNKKLKEEEASDLFKSLELIYKTGKEELGLKKLSFAIIKRLQA